jgi:hypothetical protein
LTKCWLSVIGTIFFVSLDRMTCKLYYEYYNPLTSIVQTLNQISLQSLVEISSFVILVCTYFIATLALGLRPRQRGCKGAGQREARSHIRDSRECKRVWGSEPSHSQGYSHFGRWSPGGLPKLQRPIWGVKSQWLVAFFI